MGCLPETGELTLESFKQQGDRFNNLIQGMDGVDPFCSAWYWGLAAWESFHEDTEPYFHRFSAGYLAVSRQIWPSWGRVWMPLEASWCLGCPLVGSHAPELASGLNALLSKNDDWDSVMLSGIAEDSSLWRHLIVALGRRYLIFGGPSVVRRIASLKDGPDGYMARRTSKFRNNLRRALNRVNQEHISFELHGGVWSSERQEQLFRTIMEIEALSWKGRCGEGVNHGSMRTFYKKLIEYLGPEGRCRLILARREDQPVGYILGGVLGEVYRGFQFSFHQDHGHLSLGNILQMKMIEHLCAEGVAYYDLGTDIEYKRYWAEQSMETQMMIIKR